MGIIICAFPYVLGPMAEMLFKMERTERTNLVILASNLGSMDRDPVEAEKITCFN